MIIRDFLVKKNGMWEVSFQDPELRNLEELMNAHLYHASVADFFLKKLNFIKDNWENKKTVEKRFECDYWNDEYLAETGLEYGWFSILSYESGLECYMNQEEQMIYIIQDNVPSRAISEISLDDLIDLTEQWKQICKIPVPQNKMQRMNVRDVHGINLPEKKWWEFWK